MVTRLSISGKVGKAQDLQMEAVQISRKLKKCLTVSLQADHFMSNRLGCLLSKGQKLWIVLLCDSR